MTFLVALTACGAGEAVDDLTTYTLGAGQLSEVELRRDVETASASIPVCPEGSVTAPNGSGEMITVALQPSDTGCRVGFRRTDVVIFDATEARQAEQQAGPLDIDGVKSGSLRLERVGLFDENGTRPLDDLATSASFAIDDALVLAPTPAATLQGDPVTAELPPAVIDRMVAAVQSQSAYRADVTVTIDVREAALMDLPELLGVDVVAQPVVAVDVVDAAF